MMHYVSHHTNSKLRVEQSTAPALSPWQKLANAIVPWNYTVKLEEINRMVKEFGGPDAKPKTFAGYLEECWREAMDHSDTQLKTAPKPAKAAGTKPSKGIFGK